LSTIVITAIAPSLAKKAEISIGVDKVYFNKEDGENKHYHSKPTTAVGRVHAKI